MEKVKVRLDEQRRRPIDAIRAGSKQSATASSRSPLLERRGDTNGIVEGRSNRDYKSASALSIVEHPALFLWASLFFDLPRAIPTVLIYLYSHFALKGLGRDVQFSPFAVLVRRCHASASRQGQEVVPRR